jgi:hypothetical protein
MPPESVPGRPRVLTKAVAAIALASLAWSLPASAQEGGEGPPRRAAERAAFTCDTAGTNLTTHNLKQGEINLPVSCEGYDNVRQRQIFLAPQKVVGTITVTEGVRKRLGLSSKRIASGTFSGPKKSNDGRAYYHHWIKMTASARSKMKARRVGMLPYRAELTVTWPDGSGTEEVTGTGDATRNYGACKNFGRMWYDCSYLP